MADFSSPLLQKPSQNVLEMEGFKKTFSSLPSNYVTLQQLREKRLKEQQLKQRKEKEEKEEEEMRKRQKEKEENDDEERRKSLELQKSLKTIKSNASDWPARSHREYRPKITEKRDEISAVEKEIDDQSKNIKESTKKNKGWKDKTKPKKRGTVADPADPRTGNGQEEDDPKPLPEKSTGKRKIGRGFQPSREDRPEETESKNMEDRTVEIARKRGTVSDLEEEDPKPMPEKYAGNRKIGRGFQPSREDPPEKIKSKNMEDQTAELARKIGDLSEKKADERSKAKKKGSFKESRWKIRSSEEKLPEKIKSKDRNDRTMEIAQKFGDLSVVACDNTVETDDHIEADKTAEKNHYQRPRRPRRPRRIIKDRTVEIAQTKGDAAVVDCDQTVEEMDGWKEVDERSTAEKKHEFGSLGERIPEIRPGKSENHRVERMVEIAQKVGELRVVDCDENVETLVGGKEEGERSTAEKKIRDIRPSKSENHRMDRTVEIAQKIEDLRVVDCDENVDTGGKEVGERSTAEKKIPEIRPWKSEKHRVEWRGRFRRDFGHRGRQEPSDLVWVRKEEVSNGITHDVYSSSSRSASILRPEYKESFQFIHIGEKSKEWRMREPRTQEERI